MSKQERDQLIEGHEYDGIQELNNPLPKWWLATFYGTIIFSFIYWGYFELLGGPTQDMRLAAAMEQIRAKQAAAVVSYDDSAIDLDSLLADPAALAAGKEQFDAVCVACHGPAGEGLIGPNLTDKYWIHGKGDLEHILNSFRVGYPDKGMPPWGNVIPADKQAALAAYVISLQGTNPPNAKEPQGELVE
jgi:cytochrome c oxidase cbb3-type subunit III